MRSLPGTARACSHSVGAGAAPAPSGCWRSV